MNGYGRGILGLPPVVKNIILINVLMFWLTGQDPGFLT